MKKILPIVLVLAGVTLLALSRLDLSGPVDLDVEIRPASMIMPAVHKVYENPAALNGKYYLFKAKITNDGDKNVEHVKVTYRIPGLIEREELTHIGKLIPGQSAVVAAYPKFDSSITERTTKSMEHVEIHVSWDGAEEHEAIEERFPIRFLSRNDYAYTFVPADELVGPADLIDNDILLPCFVTPNDPIVKYYTQVVQEKVLKGEAASVSQDPRQGVQFLLGLYNATLLSHMVYSGTKGIPSSIEDVDTIVQHIRLPREVITGNTGLCIELSTFYASVLSAAGLDPVIFLIPGHAYPGFRMKGEYHAIEATMINGEGLGGIADAKSAYQKGMKQLDEFIKAMQAGDPRYKLVDVHELNAQGVISMDLKDSDYLRGKVDEIAKAFERQSAKGTAVAQQQPYVPENNGTQPVQPTYPEGEGEQNPVAELEVVVPDDWIYQERPYPHFPQVAWVASSPDMLASINAFVIPGNSVQQAMEQLKQLFSQNGMMLQYGIEGTNIRGYTQYANGSQFYWSGKTRVLNQNVDIVCVGAMDQAYQNYQQQLQEIYQNIK